MLVIIHYSVSEKALDPPFKADAQAEALMGYYAYQAVDTIYITTYLAFFLKQKKKIDFDYSYSKEYNDKKLKTKSALEEKNS